MVKIEDIASNGLKAIRKKSLLAQLPKVVSVRTEKSLKAIRKKSLLALNTKIIYPTVKMS